MRSCRSVVLTLFRIIINYIHSNSYIQPYSLLSFLYVVLLSFLCRSLGGMAHYRERTGTQIQNYVVLLKSFTGKHHRAEHDKNDKNARFYSCIELLKMTAWTLGSLIRKIPITENPYYAISGCGCYVVVLVSVVAASVVTEIVIPWFSPRLHSQWQPAYNAPIEYQDSQELQSATKLSDHDTVAAFLLPAT